VPLTPAPANTLARSAAPRNLVTGLVLAGGRATRMGGLDKGLQAWQGTPMAQVALERLRPQVGAVLINANRNEAAYEAMGAPVCADLHGGFAGPLAGFHAGLSRCDTPYLVTVPCDSPRFPPDLVGRLLQALALDQADVAVAATRSQGAVQWQPVFCLMHRSLLPSLDEFIISGQARVERWLRQHRVAEQVFDDAEAFFNANTLQDLQA